jgi:predicted enzyme related to lactoylglutathione lyase
MARVTGIGGVFLRSKDPKALAAWYETHLHVTRSDYGGVTFEWSDEVPAGTGMTTWATFPAETTHFGPAHEDGPQQAMINYRVDDMDALLAELEAAGVWIDPERQEADYGKFAWIRDCDGNRVELWQPMA